MISNQSIGGLLDPRQQMLMQLGQNLGRAVSGMPMSRSPLDAYNQATLLNAQAQERDLANQYRRMQIEEQRRRIERDKEMRERIKQAMGAPTYEQMGPPTRMGETQRQLASEGEMDMGALAKIAAEQDPMGFLQMQLSQVSSPSFQTVNEGMKEVTYQLMPDGSMRRIAESPRWEPEFGEMKEPWGADPENVQKFRKEFSALPEVKDFGEVDTNFRQLAGALQSGSRTDQLAAIFGFMRSLDPGSVVRESETGMLVSSGSVFDRFNAALRSAQKGGSLTPETMNEMLKTAKRQYDVAARRYGEIQKEYTGHAAAAGVDPLRVVGKQFDPFDPYDMTPNVDVPEPLKLESPPSATPDSVPLRDMGTVRDPWAKERTLVEKARAIDERKRLRKSGNLPQDRVTDESPNDWARR